MYVASDDTTLSSVDELRDLGVTSSADLSWKSNIKKSSVQVLLLYFPDYEFFRNPDQEVMITLCTGALSAAS